LDKVHASVHIDSHAQMAAGLSLIGQDIACLLLGKPACDVLLTIPVERIDVDDEDSFDRQRRRA
jgi:hypothetical protein